ncbi:AAA family ATPase [Shimia biformata]|uniref:AAA family ATPase n=1 Tax=Shimia biformata TaxID=1294299 RepID=UPI00194FA705|nr:ATP-binding protein [Shimia biformata]
MRNQLTQLHVVCGKIASGKSSLCRELGQEPGAIILSEDDMLAGLYGPEMRSIADYVTFSERLEQVVGPHVVGVLMAGVTVVLDFQANTRVRRVWARDVADQAGVPLVVHHLDVPDEICKARLAARNASGDHPFAPTEAQFDAIVRHFQPPADEEGLDVITYKGGR